MLHTKATITRRIVMVKDPGTYDIWTDFNNSFLQYFKYFEVEFLINSLPRWHELLMHHLFTVKEANHRLDFGYYHSCPFLTLLSQETVTVGYAVLFQSHTERTNSCRQ